MTLVAQISPYDRPILIGDILLSSEKETSDLVLPTVDSIGDVFPNGSGYVPSGLTRKLYSFRNVALGWSGNKLLASYVIRQLIEHFQEEEVTWPKLSEFLQSLRIEARGNMQFSIAGYLMEGDGGAKPFGINQASEYIQGYGNCRIMGTGEEVFKEAMTKELPVVHDELDNTNNAFVYAATIANTFLSKEILLRENLLQYFGGAFEIIVKNGKEWLQVGKIMHILWIGRVLGDRLSVTPYFFTYYDYIDDYLDVLAIRISSYTKSEFGYKERRFLVPPVVTGTRKPEPEQLDEVTNHCLVCNQLVVVEDQRIVGATFRIDNYVDSSEVLLKLKRENDRLGFIFSKDMLERFFASAIERYGMRVEPDGAF